MVSDSIILLLTVSIVLIGPFTISYGFLSMIRERLVVRPGVTLTGWRAIGGGLACVVLGVAIIFFLYSMAKAFPLRP